MLKEFNSSKGMRNTEQWAQTELGQQVNADYMSNLDSIQRDNAAQINEILNGGPVGPDWFDKYFNP